MGGFDSGRDRYATTATVTESFSLAIADLKEHLELGEAIGWGWGDPGDPKIKIGVRPEEEATATSSTPTETSPGTAWRRPTRRFHAGWYSCPPRLRTAPPSPSTSGTGSR